MKNGQTLVEAMEECIKDESYVDEGAMVEDKKQAEFIVFQGFATVFEKFAVDADEVERIIERLCFDKEEYIAEKADKALCDGFAWACNVSYCDLLFVVQNEKCIREYGIEAIKSWASEAAKDLVAYFNNESWASPSYSDEWVEGVMSFWKAVKDQI